jgi:hypothetical protein
MADYFRWKNCDHVDVHASYFNAKVVTAYLEEVVRPSLAALDRQIESLKGEQRAFAVIAADEVQMLLRATIEAYCLAVQSLFERQLREYLSGCARILQPELVPEIHKATWDKLNKHFQVLRGLALADFQQFDSLDYLQLLGNVCRHGEGRSLTKLHEKHPELWPGLGHQIPGPDGKPMPFVPSAYNLVLVRGQLETFVESIVGFWEVVDYIYNESIDNKSEALVRRLPELRNEWAGMIRQNVDAGLG